MKYRCVFSGVSCVAIMAIFFQKIKRGICRGRYRPKGTIKTMGSVSSEESLDKSKHNETEEINTNS